jgi:hypothetical protein
VIGREPENPVGGIQWSGVVFTWSTVTVTPLLTSHVGVEIGELSASFQTPGVRPHAGS